MPRPSARVFAPDPRPPALVLAATRQPRRRRARGSRRATAKGESRPDCPGGVSDACSPSRRGAPRRGAASAVCSGGCGRRRRARPGRSHSPVAASAPHGGAGLRLHRPRASPSGAIHSEQARPTGARDMRTALAASNRRGAPRHRARRGLRDRRLRAAGRTLSPRGPKSTVASEDSAGRRGPRARSRRALGQDWRDPANRGAM